MDHLSDRARVGLPDSRADVTIPADETSLLSEGDAYSAEIHKSPNGKYTLYRAEGHGDATDVEEGEEVPRVDNGVFVFRGETFLYEYAAQRPRRGDIANDGTTVIVDVPSDQIESSPRGNTVYIFDSKGNILHTNEFEENVMAATISPSGDYMACSTPPSDENSIYLFDVADGSLETWHEADCDSIYDIEFRRDDDLFIDIFDYPDQPAAYSIGAHGEIAAQSDSDADRIDHNLDELVETVSEGAGTENELELRWSDLCNVVSMAPDAFDTKIHVSRLLDAIEDGKVPDPRQDEMYTMSPSANVIVKLADEAPSKILPFADRLVGLLAHDEWIAAGIAGHALRTLFVNVYTELNSDEMDPYVSDIKRLMESEDEQTRKWASMAYKGVTRAERYGHDYSSVVEDERSGVEIQIERLRTEESADQLGDACSTLKTAFKEDEELASEHIDLIPRLLSILEDYEPDLEYCDGEDEAYEYRDTEHAKRYGCVKSVMRTLIELAPHDPQKFEGTMDRFFRYTQTRGDTNTNIRGPASLLLQNLAAADQEWFWDELQAHEEELFEILQNPAGGRVFSRSLAICRHYTKVAPGRLEPVLPDLIYFISADSAYAALQTVATEAPDTLADQEDLLVQCLESDNRGPRERVTELLETLAAADHLSDEAIHKIIHQLPSDTLDPVHRSLLDVVATAANSGMSLPESAWEWLAANADHDDWQIRVAIARIATSSDCSEAERILAELREDPIPDVQAAASE